MNDIQDATTVAFFRERLLKAGVIEELFEMFEGYLRDQGLEARGSQIIDATLVPAPIQRNTREENKYIKAERLQDGWEENPNRLQLRDLDVRWVKKNGINHYGYKNSICIDAEHDFIRRFVFHQPIFMTVRYFQCSLICKIKITMSGLTSPIQDLTLQIC